MLNNLLNIGKTSLQASQAWMNVTGNNIANADTEGYSRQYIDQRDNYAINYRPGAMGMGVNAQQVLRYYDSFLEQSYIRQNTNSARWDEQDKLMTSLETLFNESNRTGLSSTLQNYFKAWSDLGLYPDSTAHRASLLSYADKLRDMFSNTAEQIRKLQRDMSVSIQDTVKRVNEISRAIADLNRQITANTIDGISNPNSLLDQRDQLVRELSGLINVQTTDNGKGNFTVQLTTGQPLVEGETIYELAYLDGHTQTQYRLQANSAYKGKVEYEGSDGFEYTLDMLSGNKFRVSLDGGRTWLKGDDGQELRFDITDRDGDGKSDPVRVKNLTISFTDIYQTNNDGKFVDAAGHVLTWDATQGPDGAWVLDDPNSPDKGKVIDAAGKVLTWDATQGPDGAWVNANGEVIDAAGNVLTWDAAKGPEGAWVNANGEVIDATGKVLTWNGKTWQDAAGVEGTPTSPINPTSPAITLGAGDKFDLTPKDALYWIEPTRGPQNVTPQVYLDGTDNKDRVYGGKMASYFNIRDDNCARYLDELDATARSLIWEVNRQHSQGAGLQKFDSLQGTESVGDTGQPLGSWQSRLVFSDKLQAGTIQFHFYDKLTDKGHLSSATLDFDPATDSLEDVMAKINALTDKDGKQLLQASIQNGRLEIISNNADQQFVLGADSSGLMAALGVNTFFSGNSAESLAVNEMLHKNSHWVASGQVNGNFEVNEGDGATATAIGELAKKDVTISTTWKTVDNQTISEFYANLVSEVGSERRLSKTNSEYHSTLTQDLFERSQAVSGVNLDEEMTNLIKYQHSYIAAAKLITTADQMLQTLLGIKQ